MLASRPVTAMTDPLAGLPATVGKTSLSAAQIG
jgi:hypothetical protein